MKPLLARDIGSVRQAVELARRDGLTIGLVPTMGALHEGHASLMRAARRETGFVVASIFVNPTQFGPTEDLARYPRPLEKDLEMCSNEGVALVFAPQAGEMYPEGFRTFVEITELQDILCGASRPGHFRGVATVVLKLFQIVRPDVAYFGQKDAQQTLIIRQMVRDLDVPVRIRVCPIVRAPDGLALSSRNQYLDAGQRSQAAVLSRALQAGRGSIEAGERDASAIRESITSQIQAVPSAEIDYVAVVDAGTLRPVDSIHGDVLIAVAVSFGRTRLIDNLLLNGIS